MPLPSLARRHTPLLRPRVPAHPCRALLLPRFTTRTPRAASVSASAHRAPMAHAVTRSTADPAAYFVAGDEWRVGDR